MTLKTLKKVFDIVPPSAFAHAFNLLCDEVGATLYKLKGNARDLAEESLDREAMYESLLPFVEEEKAYDDEGPEPALGSKWLDQRCPSCNQWGAYKEYCPKCGTHYESEEWKDELRRRKNIGENIRRF